MAGAISEAERLLLELQHRVKNLAAVIRGIARRTASSSATLEDFQTRFDGRLEALVRAHAAMARSGRTGLDLAEVVGDTLLANSLVGENWSVVGDSVRLSHAAAEMLTLLIHELAVESATAGALGSRTGRLDVAWTAAGGRLRFEWTESGLIDRPSPGGFEFARELIDAGLPYQLKAEAEVEVRSAGLRFWIELPLPQDVPP